MTYLLLDFLVLRAIVMYHIMIPLSPLFINWCATSAFCQHDMHDTIYKTSHNRKYHVYDTSL
jgi:hypothetical protein